MSGSCTDRPVPLSRKPASVTNVEAPADVDADNAYVIEIEAAEAKHRPGSSPSSRVPKNAPILSE